MRKVVVLIESSRAHGRGLLRGVSRYIHECGDWSIFFEPHGLGDPPPVWLSRWTGDGILVRITNQRMAQAVLKTGKPVVDVRGALPDLGIPVVGPDNSAVGKMGAEHLLGRGLRHFGFFGYPWGALSHSDVRCETFVRRIEAAGMHAHVYEARPATAGHPWEQEQQRLAAWVDGLPKPVGVMACHDDLGLWLLDAGRRAEVSSPDQMAVIGVDNDEVECDLAFPPMTSIDLSPERIGYEAAALLDRMMNGEPPPKKPIYLPPQRVVMRQSTDVVAVEDPEVAAALRLIQQHACDGLRVGELLDRLQLSQSSLERRFRRMIGRSPKAEITRVQLDHAKQLLVETGFSIDKIAERTGFRDARYLCEVFSRKLGRTPNTYRKQARRRP